VYLRTIPLESLRGFISRDDDLMISEAIDYIFLSCASLFFPNRVSDYVMFHMFLHILFWSFFVTGRKCPALLMLRRYQGFTVYDSS